MTTIDRLGPLNNMRAKIETLSAKGYDLRAICNELGCAISYAEQVVGGLNGHAAGDNSRIESDLDRKYVNRCLEEGGFVSRHLIGGRVVEVRPEHPDVTRWKAIGRRCAG